MQYGEPIAVPWKGQRITKLLQHYPLPSCQGVDSFSRVPVRSTFNNLRDVYTEALLETYAFLLSAKRISRFTSRHQFSHNGGKSKVRKYYRMNRPTRSRPAATPRFVRASAFPPRRPLTSRPSSLRIGRGVMRRLNIEGRPVLSLRPRTLTHVRHLPFQQNKKT
ncbi:hypothetical protein NDU88_005459 [Pleurodeles waltl]|uniref:Uncharacterized protein n=1 Tax=Pleurodeles waltl TaxID=8319 RepID=A0AAV7TB27_PLEWA|nr:hypothetical protein NDU88_005459 [Pleurodeles waltl]